MLSILTCILCLPNCGIRATAEKMLKIFLNFMLLRTVAGHILQYRPGDVILVGLMKVHSRGTNCVEIAEDGMQAVEMMNMVIDQTNQDTTILPGIKLGTIMIDTCGLDLLALRQVVLEIVPHIWNITNRPSNSSSEKSQIPTSLIAGVVGGASSAVSIQVASLLGIFEITQVSYWSTSPDLSNKDRYKYFFRVVPSDTHQARAMVAFAKEQNWNYISVVYEEYFYGYRAFLEVKEIAAENGICIATSQPVARRPTEKDLEYIVLKLEEAKAKAVIVFTNWDDASNILLAVQKFAKKNDNFIWIASDSWSKLVPLEKGENLKDEIVDGSIGFAPKATHIKMFDEYFTNITLAENDISEGKYRNPWFPKYISRTKNCSISNGADTKRKCSGDEKVDPKKFQQLMIMENVADSVRSFVYALEQYHQDTCRRKFGVCEEMKRLTGTNGLAKALYNYMTKLTFPGINGRNITFDKYQDGPAVYDILNYQGNKQVSGSKLQKWVNVGIYESGNITWEHRLVEKVSKAHSVCSKPCEKGQAKIISTEICCWHCQTCQNNEYVSHNGSECLKCDKGLKPDVNRTSCVPIPITEMSYTSVYGTVCICIGSLGLLMTFAVTGIYIAYRDTAIVKASGKELCFFVLFGVLITFLNFLSTIANPNVASCVMSRFILAIGPTFMYAGLLTKTIRIVIIFQSRAFLTEKVKVFLKPTPQILCTLGLVAIQLIALAVWFAISKPEVSVLHPTHDIAFRACIHLVDVSILVGLIYPFVLIIICTILATINRNVPLGFNETQYIGFSMYTTCVIWLAFLPIFVTNPLDLPQRIMTTSVCLSLSATTVLICLFGPRCFTILFHPEENTQKSVMSTGVERSVTRNSMPNISTIPEQSCQKQSVVKDDSNDIKQAVQPTTTDKTANSDSPTKKKTTPGCDKKALPCNECSITDVHIEVQTDTRL